VSGPAEKEDRLGIRLLVAFLGGPVLLGIIWWGGIAYALFVTVMVILGLWEYLRLLERGGLTPRPIPSFLAALALLAACAHHVGFFGQSPAWETLGLQFFTIVFIMVLVLQTVEVLQPSRTAWMNLSAHVLGILWIAGFGASFILVRSADFASFNLSVDAAYRLTMSLYVSVWSCDTAAYFMGKRFGKKKILPLVSPKKTVAGTVSGLIGALLMMFLLGISGFLPGEVFSTVHLLILGLIVGLAGQMGDFAESRLKRDFDVKDTSALLPGHGGVLDRFDSLLFVMPLTYLYLMLAVLP